MSLVYLVASAPWGPVRIEHAASMGALLRQATAQPAHIEDCGELDAGQVAEVARGMLPPADAAGWIAARVKMARKAVQDARGRVSARVVAIKAVEAAHGAPESHGGAAVVLSSVPPRRRSSSADIDVKGVRAGLKMTQAEFAKAWGFSLAAVRDWEQGRAAPEASTRILLAFIAHRPDVVRDAQAALG